MVFSCRKQGNLVTHWLTDSITHGGQTLYYHTWLMASQRRFAEQLCPQGSWHYQQCVGLPQQPAPRPSPKGPCRSWFWWNKTHLDFALKLRTRTNVISSYLTDGCPEEFCRTGFFFSQGSLKNKVYVLQFQIWMDPISREIPNFAN